MHRLLRHASGALEKELTEVLLDAGPEAADGCAFALVSLAEQKEVDHEVGVPPDEAEFAAELTPRVVKGRATGHPLPPPAREGTVEAVQNHQVTGASEHKIVIPKGL